MFQNLQLRYLIKMNVELEELQMERKGQDFSALCCRKL